MSSNHTAEARLGAGWVLKILGIALLPFVLDGCLSRQPLNVQTFAFSPHAISSPHVDGNGCVIGIKSLQVAPPFAGRSLIYRTGQFSYERDAYAEFLEPPAEMLVTPVSELLARAGDCRAVVGLNDALRPNRLAEIEVTELYGDIRKPRSPSAVLSMQMTFADATNGLAGKVLFTRTYSRSIPIKSSAPAALMAGWNQALAEIISEVDSEMQLSETTVKTP